MTTREEKIIYLAGLIDGEGCIGAYNVRSKSDVKRAQNYVVNLRVVMKTPKAIKLLHEVFGGCLNVYSNKGPGKLGPYFSWQLRASKCVAALKELLPHLLEKKDQAETAIEYHELCLKQRKSWERAVRYPDSYLEEREEYIAKLKSQKRVQYIGNELQ